MALAFLRRDREPITEPEAMPNPPPAENPFTEAQRQWTELRHYAVEAMEAARATAVRNRQLLSDNEALGRQIDHLMQLNASLVKDNRLVRAYATSVRTRLTVIRESIEQAERESLEHAHREVTERAPDSAPEDEAELREVVHGIERHGTTPPTNEFRR